MIVYERKVKLLFGKFSDSIIFSITLLLLLLVSPLVLIFAGLSH